MRRLLSTWLLVAFLAPLLAPLLAVSQGADSSLPACCRRNGAHHCAMSMAERASTSLAVSQVPTWKAPLERCPYCPAALSSTHPLTAFLLPPGRLQRDALFAHPTGAVQTESRRRIARDRSRQKRGPPPPLGSLLS